MTSATSPTRSNTRPRVVVGVDGSEESKQALRWGARIAAAENARLEAITVWQFPATFIQAYVPVSVDQTQDMEKALTDIVDEVFGPDRPADMHLAVLEGGTAHVLLRESADAVMLVVGSRGHGGFAGLLLGSVSHNLAAHSSCPVLIVHAEKRDELDTEAAT